MGWSFRAGICHEYYIFYGTKWKGKEYERIENY